VYFQFIGYPDESVHLSNFCGKKFLYPLVAVLLNYIIKLHVLSYIINHDHVSIAFAIIIIRVALQE